MSLLVTTLAICTFEYSTNFYKVNNLTVIYFVFCLTILIIIIIVPIIFSLFGSVISDQFIANEISKIKTWGIIYKDGIPTIDNQLRVITSICVQQIKSGDTETAASIVSKISDKHFEIIEEILSIATINAQAININGQIFFISSFVWKNIIEESIKESDTNIAFITLARIFQYLKFLSSKKVDKNCLNELFISIAEINQLLINSDLYSVVEKEIILLGDLVKTILQISELDTTNPDENFAIKPIYLISLYSLLFELDFLIYQLVTDLVAKNQYQIAIKVLEFYDECWIRFSDSSIKDETKYRLQKKILEESINMHIYILDAIGVSTIMNKNSYRLPGKREIDVNHLYIIEIVSLISDYIIELAKRNVLMIGNSSVIHNLYLIGISACGKIFDLNSKKIVQIILETYHQALLSLNNQKAFANEFNKDASIFIRKIEALNTDGSLDDLIIDLKLMRNKFYVKDN